MKSLVLTSACFCLSSTLSSYEGQSLDEGCWEASLEVVGSQRWDEFFNHIRFYGEKDATIRTDNFHVNSLHVYSYGGRGWLFWNHWFLRGDATTGHVSHGDFRSEIKTASTLLRSETLAHIKKGNTQDDNVGFGYLFPIRWLSLGPLFGWAYNEIHLKMDHVKIHKKPIPTLEGFTYRTRWQGPWVGFEGMYSWCGLDFDFGYEYHFPFWHGKLDLNGPTVPGVIFSDKRHGRGGYGSVFFVRSYATMMAGLQGGLSFKYQDWRLWDGRVEPLKSSFASVGETLVVDARVPKSTWRSFEIQLSLGYLF
jgi:hypothetical protein